MSPKRRPPSFYVCLNADKGATLAYGTLGDVQTEITAGFGSCIAALQVTDETAAGLFLAGFKLYECGKARPPKAWFDGLTP